MPNLNWRERLKKGKELVVQSCSRYVCAMVRDHDAACFESCPRDGGRAWQIMVTWQHSLRERIQGLTFSSEEEADLWIKSNSLSWRARNDRSVLDGRATWASKRAINPRNGISIRQTAMNREQLREIEIRSLRDQLAQLSKKVAAASHVPSGGVVER